MSVTVALAHFTREPKENPYVWSLGEAVEAAGVDVLAMPASAFFLRYASARRASVIHFQWFETLVGATSWFKMALKCIVFLAQMKLCLLLGKRLVWTVHNAKSHEQQFPKLERWIVSSMARNVHAIIVHCEAAKDELCRYLPEVDARKVHVVEHGSFIGIYPNDLSREEARRAFDFGDDDIVILFLGNIRPYKGLDDLIAAFRKVRRDNTKLLIAGKPLNDTIRADIEQHCRDEPNILFQPGFIDDDDLQKYFLASDVVAFPYRSILTSGAVILAISYGRACIAPDLGCIASVADPAANFLYSPVGVGPLASKLEEAIGDRDRLVAGGAANYQRALELDWRRIGEKMASIYRAGRDTEARS